MQLYCMDSNDIVFIPLSLSLYIYIEMYIMGDVQTAWSKKVVLIWPGHNKQLFSYAVGMKQAHLGASD